MKMNWFEKIITIVSWLLFAPMIYHISYCSPLVANDIFNYHIIKALNYLGIAVTCSLIWTLYLNYRHFVKMEEEAAKKAAAEKEKNDKKATEEAAREKKYDDLRVYVGQPQMELVDVCNVLIETQKQLRLAIQDREGFRRTLIGVREELNRERERLQKEKEFNKYLITENEMKLYHDKEGVQIKDLEKELEDTKEMLAMFESLCRSAMTDAKKLREDVQRLKRYIRNNGNNRDGDYIRLWNKNDELLAKNAELEQKLKDANDALIEANRKT